MSKKMAVILITAIALALTIAISFAGAMLTRDKIENNLVNQYGQQELLIARETAKILEAEVSNIREKLTLIAGYPEMYSTDGEVCSKKLEEVFAQMDEKVSNIGRMNNKGVFVCSINRQSIGIDGTKYPHLKKIIEEKVPVLGRGLVSAADNTFVTSLHIPIYDTAGAFDGTLGGAISFSQIADKFLKDITFAKQGYVALIDDNGDTLYHPTKAFIGKNFWGEELQKATAGNKDLNDMIKEGVAGKTGIKRYVFGGKEKVAAYVPANIFPDRRWLVTITVPIEDVKTAVAGTEITAIFLRLAMVLALVMVIAAAISVLYLVRSVFNPITEITNAVDDISRGNLNRTIAAPEGRDEIGKLVAAFNRVVVSLKLAMKK